jgi:Signal peptidase, peptidase S26
MASFAFAAGLVAVLLFNFAVSAALLWLACLICRVPARARPATSPLPEPTPPGSIGRVGVVRLLITALLTWLLQVLVLLGVKVVLDRLPFPPELVLAGSAVIAFVLAVLCVALVLRVRFGKALQVGLLWMGLLVPYAILFALVAPFVVMEGFVVPTGAMAETIEGYHKDVTCPQCGYRFAVNSSQEVDPAGGPAVPVVGCTCPNCRFHVELNRKGEGRRNEGGDRVLVGKGLFGPAGLPPGRLEVAVHVLPDAEQARGRRLLYVKRLVGLPGETVAIHGGDLFVLPPQDAPAYDNQQFASDKLWTKDAMHPNDEEAVRRFSEHRFRIVRKPLDLVLAQRHVVYDNDHPAKDLPGKEWQRWQPGPGSSWSAADPDGFRCSAGGDGVDFLRYRHRLRRTAGPELITDFSAYNSFEPTHALEEPRDWVGDLILECEVTLEKAEGELTLELSKGVDRFRARWDLGSGACTLYRQTVGKAEEAVGEGRPTAVKQAGTYRLRFADVDQRLTAWVDGALPFGDGVPYDAPGKEGPDPTNDFEPASVGVKGGTVSLHHLKLWRDTYYTVEPGSADWQGEGRPGPMDWGDPKWEVLSQLPVKTLYVQPGHYLFLGDNSPESADSRFWGLVPEKLLVGKAFYRYYPLDRLGPVP